MASKVEFQAVVLAAGKGSRMPEITAGKPKCLIPVGTKPLVWYPLRKLQQSGFTDVMMIVLDTQKSEIQATLDKEKSNLQLKIEYIVISANEDIGTADSLRLIKDKLKSDVLVISCDFITDVSLEEVINSFRMNDASVAALLFHPQPSEDFVVPGTKSKYKPERDLIGIDHQTNRMVFLASASDFDTTVPLSRTLLRKHPDFNMYSMLLDSHVYLLKNWVIKYLHKQPSISTIKGELLPHIVKKQLSKPPKSPEDKSVDTTPDDKDIFTYAKEDKATLAVREMSSYTDHIGDLKPVYHGDCIRCYATIASEDSFGVRINSIPAYWSINNNIRDKWEKIASGIEFVAKHPKSQIKSSQVDDKCVIWDGAKLNEKTSFKRAVIGSNTEVCSFSRVFNSIIMNNVTIKEKVVLENCIVSDGATINAGCQLKGCLVGSGHEVAENSNHSQEVLAKPSRLLEF